MGDYLVTLGQQYLIMVTKNKVSAVKEARKLHRESTLPPRLLKVQDYGKGT